MSMDGSTTRGFGNVVAAKSHERDTSAVITRRFRWIAAIVASCATAIATLIWSPIFPVASLRAHDGGDAVIELLRDPIWRDRDAYDAAHFLMVPMHEAFQAGKLRRIAEFRIFFDRAHQNRDELVKGRLSRLQFLYLISRFVALESKVKPCSNAVVPLGQWLGDEVNNALTSPAWLWGRHDFPDMFQRLDYKLSDKPAARSYYKAIFDEELFALAIASDLVYAFRGCSLTLPPAVSKANELHPVIWTTLGHTERGRWIFQPGVWTEHPDFKFAGHPALKSDLEPRPVKGIGWDTSHASRHPLFLLSAACGQQGDERSKLNSIRKRLAQTFLDIVLVPPTVDRPAYLTRNFMTGENGVYRYGYGTKGKSGGYGPFQLSGTFMLGWWAFASDQLRPIYARQASLMPFDHQLLNYFGEGTVTDPTRARPRHPLMGAEGYANGQLVRAIVGAASRLSAESFACTPEKQLVKD